ncbi:hypothetical protein L218DRAFT_953963 [Marasmius fiardii PR-910]|nr:hypothetical protein L218DRAFT_953963 [Marasmius fiardii PR-910]
MPRRNVTTAPRSSNSLSGLPLRDTETALHDRIVLNSNTRSKRRTKAPTGALGRKLKRAEQEQISSLPPSSPIGPSSSNSLPIASSDDGNRDLQDLQEPQGQSFWMDEGGDWKENIDFSSQCYDEHGNFITPRLQEEPKEAFPMNDSDPFGFFAVEEKLKAERSRQPPKVNKSLLPPSKPIAESFKPPRTPHKRRIGKRARTNSSRNGSSPARSDILPSSPSPTKRFSERFTTRETDLGDDVGSALMVDDDSPPKADVKRKKPRRSDSSVDPERLAKSLTSLLPKRRRRGKNSRSYKDEDDSDEQPVVTKRQIRGRRKLREVFKRDVDEELELDVDEKMAQERQARLEYFKKLQNYEIVKENVYVI